MGKSISKHEIALAIVEQFKALYRELNAETCSSGIIESLYDENLLFEDSFHKIEGVENFRLYCESLYENLQACEFEFHDQWVCNEDAMLIWTMRYRHPKINKGKTVAVDGASLIRFEDKVTYHRDYFDGGALLYEHIPLVGSLIKQLKRRMV